VEKRKTNVNEKETKTLSEFCGQSRDYALTLSKVLATRGKRH